jgi:hypothetical protein
MLLPQADGSDLTGSMKKIMMFEWEFLWAIKLCFANDE